MKFEKMKTIREDRELKQWQIAEELNVDRTTYSGWETGKDTIPLRKLYELSNYYKLSIDYIVGLFPKKQYIYTGDFIDLIIVGKNLKKLRAKNNLKQNDLIKMLNISPSSYSAYEKGQVLIQTSFIYEIAKKYDASIDEIIKNNE